MGHNSLGNSFVIRCVQSQYYFSARILLPAQVGSRQKQTDLFSPLLAWNLRYWNHLASLNALSPPSAVWYGMVWVKDALSSVCLGAVCQHCFAAVEFVQQKEQ